MRLGIMQPYFVPYIGYFQLMAAVEKFVLLDDVTYIKGGWINRNRILVNGEPKWLTIPLTKASQNKLIRDITIQTAPSWKLHILRSVEAAYRKAPFFKQGFSILENILRNDEIHLSRFLYRSLSILTDHLGINAEIVPTSSVYPKGDLTGASRILDICLREATEVYVNAPGGRALYDAEVFRRSGVKLQFLEPILPTYWQNTETFTPGLSIIDALMWNDPTELPGMIHRYALSQ